jgi:Holliday junction resolvase
VTEIRLRYKDFLIFSVPNGGSRNKIEAIKLKRTGLLAGIPDLICLMPNKKVVFIEMKKRKNGKLTLSQKVIFPIIESFGFDILICEGFEEALIKFENYLKFN